MEKQLLQFVNNVKTYCKRVLMLMGAASFASAALITANGEAAKNVLPFRQVALSQYTNENASYAFGEIQHEEYHAIQNQAMVADAFAQAGALEPEIADVEARETEMVAQSYSASSAAPVYADPSMSGYEYLGTYLTTGYCPCARCCGKSNGITASGTHASANHTIAADTRVLPFGTQVVLNGTVYTVEDRGGAIQGNRIDIFFSSHQEALNYGKRYVMVYRYVGTSENASEVAIETISETPDLNGENAKETGVSTQSDSLEATESGTTTSLEQNAGSTETVNTTAGTAGQNTSVSSME